MPYGLPIGGQPLGPRTAADVLAEIQGLEEPALPEPGQFQTTPFEGFLERIGSVGLPDVPAGGGAFSDFLGGLTGTLQGRGQQIARQRQRFEQQSDKQRAERNAANLEASRERRRRLFEELNQLRGEERAISREERERANLESDAYLRGRGTRRAEAEFPNPRAEEREPLVDVIDPKTGKRILVPRSQAAGMTPGGASEQIKPARPSQGEREQLTADLGLIQGINSVREGFNPRFVGPAAGRLGGVQQATGLGLTKGESGFRAQVAGLRNQIGKLRSGQAISESEAARLMEELPKVTDPSEVFLAKLDSFEKLYRSIAETRRNVLSGTGVDVSGVPALPTAPNPRARRKPLSAIYGGQ